jgi:hypothetical protein
MHSYEPEPREIELEECWRPESERRHSHYCPDHSALYMCGCSCPEIDDLVCNRCDESAADNLIAA